MNARSRRALSIESLKVESFRALRKVQIDDLTPLTVLVGPTVAASGKSTVLDVFAFLSECFELGWRWAWDKRGRSQELKTRGSSGPLVIEIGYRERSYPLITYHLAVEEIASAPVVIEEWLQWRRYERGQRLRFLDYHEVRYGAIATATLSPRAYRISLA